MYPPQFVCKNPRSNLQVTQTPHQGGNKQGFVLVANIQGWSFDTLPVGIDDHPRSDLAIERPTIKDIKEANKRDLCITSTTIEARWHADFAKIFDGKLVQVEAQFGKVESMFKDFCGFKITVRI